jgi:hypothetical protein
MLSRSKESLKFGRGLEKILPEASRCGQQICISQGHLCTTLCYRNPRKLRNPELKTNLRRKHSCGLGTSLLSSDVAAGWVDSRAPT